MNGRVDHICGVCGHVMVDQSNGRYWCLSCSEERGKVTDIEVSVIGLGVVVYPAPRPKVHLVISSG